MSELRKIIFGFLLCCAVSGSANAQYFTNINRNEDIFNYEVKVIDEFFERFNDDPKSFIRTAYKNQKKAFNVNRGQLLVSLFNLSNGALAGDTTINGFIRQVTTNNEFINFTDTNWYANIVAIVDYNGKQMEVPMVLHIFASKEGWAKWMIASAGELRPTKEPKSSVNYKEFKVNVPPTYISTSAVSTDFSELHHVFASNINQANFFDKAFLNTEQGKAFCGLLKSDKIHFLYVSNIRFTFFQVSNWVFTVEQFKRQSLNSGWLINDIKKVSEAEKTELEHKLLLR